MAPASVVSMWRLFVSYAALDVYVYGLGAREYCQSESFKATCWTNEVIVMEAAMYGRMSLGRCVEADLGYIGCSTDVLHLADKWCSGKRTCNIGVPNADLDNTQPCFKELKTYLQTDYRCVRVATAQKSLCESSSYVKLVSTQGFLASLTTDDTGCGSPGTPWIIEAEPGQRINVTLMDFTRFNVAATVGQRYDIRGCRNYALVRERGRNKNVTVCASDARERHVHMSSSNTLEITITKKKEEPYYFLLRYETIGCADLVPASNAWFERTPSGGVVGCKMSDSTWHLSCEETKWVGVIGNCSTYSVTSKNTLLYGPGGLPYGVSIAIIIAIALLIGLVILGIGLLCFARKREPSARAQSDPYYLSKTVPPSGDRQVYHKSAVGVQSSVPPLSPDCFIPVEATRTTVHCGNDYAHIWETPLPEPEELDSLQEGMYSSQCECPYGRARKVDCAEGHVTMTYTPQEDVPTNGNSPRKAFLATKTLPVHKEDCFEGHRYFVLDTESALPETGPCGGPDIIPMELS